MKVWEITYLSDNAHLVTTRLIQHCPAVLSMSGRAGSIQSKSLRLFHCINELCPVISGQRRLKANEQLISTAVSHILRRGALSPVYRPPGQCTRSPFSSWGLSLQSTERIPVWCRGAGSAAVAWCEWPLLERSQGSSSVADPPWAG